MEKPTVSFFETASYFWKNVGKSSSDANWYSSPHFLASQTKRTSLIWAANEDAAKARNKRTNTFFIILLPS
ncbi:MAG: hypothetical protein IKJ76_11700 [Fibrobacter sp.]|nr:hypothetical protein [Fibrobacter sp.]